MKNQQSFRVAIFFFVLFFSLTTFGQNADQSTFGKLFKRQQRTQLFIESEPFPWGNNGFDVKAGLLGKKHSIGVRLFSHKLPNKSLIFNGADDESITIDLNFAYNLEYRYFFYHNFYAGLWLGHERWTASNVIRTQEQTLTNWFITPQVGYLWMPLNNVYLNLGFRSVVIFGESNNTSINNIDFAFRRTTFIPTIALGLKFP